MQFFNPVAICGKTSLLLFQELGGLLLFAWETLLAAKRYRFYWRELLKQIMIIGYYSLPVIGLTAIFTGAVLALQSYSGFSRFNAESSIASVVVLSITRELGPVLAGLMLSGRVAAAIAAEVGTMKVTEQLDALYTLGANPFAFLFLPRVLAGMIVMPLLVIVADIIGVMGGYLVGVYELGFSSYTYINNTYQFLEWQDVQSGLIKAIFFGLIVTLLGCYSGYHSEKGAQGVGRATTQAVVGASIMILLANYIITGILFGN